MRKAVSIILAAVMMLMCSVSIVVADEKPIRVTVDGKEVHFDVEPLLLNDRVLVPMRFIFEALGAKVEWDEKAEQAIGTLDDVTVKIAIGVKVMTVNNISFELDQPAIVENGRTLVPVRAISESLKCDVKWEENARTVVITSKQKQPEQSEEPDDSLPAATEYFIVVNGFKSENLGTFKTESNSIAYDNTVLLGMTTNKPQETKNATIEIDITVAGEYVVWGRARDYAANQPGTRKLKLKVDSTLFDTEIGNHGTEGFQWQKVGQVKLSKGKVMIEVVDSVAFYGRIDGIFLTTDKDLVPPEKFEEMCKLAKPIGVVDLENVELPKELNQRGGLPNFFQKIKEGKQINIGYIGGSITQAAGYRVQSLDWFTKQYPNAKFNLVSAGVSGTGSDLGALRLHQDIISKKCDLVFVEFAVNDTGRPENAIKENMEGIIRQLWKADANTDVVFIYTLQESNANYVKQGLYPNWTKYMDEVAAKYNIPSIFLGIEIVEKMLREELVFKAAAGSVSDKIIFTNDGVHPTTVGHQIYTDVIARSMLQMEKNAKSEAHVIPTPLVSDRFEKVVMLDPREANPSAGWKFHDPASDSVAAAHTYMFDGFLRAEKPGESLTFKFKGTAIGIYDVGGPETGQVIIKVDGEEFLLERFTVHSHRNRPQYIFVPKTFEDKVHEVEIILGDKQADKESIMKSQNQTYTKENFDKTVVNMGKILIVGEVIK